MTHKKRILILFQPDEMRHPYDHVVKDSAVELTWIPKVDDLLQWDSANPPSGVVVDLDCLLEPIEPTLETIRAHFPSSELIAVSGSDSSQLALQCVRSGFSDFLLKPVSPEEFAWSLAKCNQRQDTCARLEGRHSHMVRAVKQLSSTTTPSLVRLYTLENILEIVGAEGGAWLKTTGTTSAPTVLGSIPRKATSAQIISKFPKKALITPEAPVYKSRKTGTRKLIVRGDALADNWLFFWGIPGQLHQKHIDEATTLMEHAQLCLLNLQKFEDIKKRTFIDDVTGLYNSRYLKFAITNTIRKAKQTQSPFAVLFIDVDHFKRINDTHGHLVGSAFLPIIGKSIRNAVRAIDPVFRYGGDEFVVILNDTAPGGATEIAERIRRQIERRTFLVKDKKINTTVSIGIACFPKHTQNQETLLQLADTAMYQVKHSSRNAVYMAVTDNQPTQKEAR